jgi:predicted transcriptional regulator of viral defense system
MKKTASLAILEQLSADNRRVFSDWRSLILWRRATFATSAAERRWTRLPGHVDEVHPLLRQMESRGEIKPIPRLDSIYQVTVPYARTGHVDEHEILMEVHPFAALSHLTALRFHELTDQFPKIIMAMAPTDQTGGLLPPDTDATDWDGIHLVRGRLISHVLDRSIDWTRVKPERYFGINLYRPRGYPVRVTSPERTLLDGLQHPDLSGGIQNVMQAWARARDLLRLDDVVQYVDRFDVAVLRQRVGFILDELGLSHPRLEEWRVQAGRGGSSKLLGSAPSAPTYSKRWNLSINVPTSPLHEAGW